MSAHLHTSDALFERPHEPAVELGDWLEAAAVVLMLFSAAAVIATILALLIIV